MKILILSNLVSYTYNFRKELIRTLINSGNKVTVVADNDDFSKADKLGCKLINVSFDGKGTNIASEYRLLKTYRKIINELKPDVVLSFTIKMNLYGGIVCRQKKIPFYPMITGLGEVAKRGKLQKILLMLHRFVMKKAQCIFFQNESDRQFFDKHRIKYTKYVTVPGSGINLKDFKFSMYPPENPLTFAFIGRITKAKGIEQFLDAANTFKNRGYRFYVAGKCDSEYEETIKQLNSSGVIKYWGVLSDTKSLFQMIHCVVLPTYHPEGMSNVLLEAGATGRPAICTNRTGCNEIIEEGINGFFCKECDSEDLNRVINNFSLISLSEKESMGIMARAKVERNFNRKVVVDSYLKVLGLQ